MTRLFVESENSPRYIKCSRLGKRGKHKISDYLARTG